MTKNNDRDFLRLIYKFKISNPDNNRYIDVMNVEISRIATRFVRVNNEISIFVYFQNEGSYKVSLHFFENRTLSEFRILLNKVCKNSKLKEIIHERLIEFSSRASPHVIHLPYQVKLHKSSIIETCNLDPQCLKDYSARLLIWMENHLRNVGFGSAEKMEAVDLI